LNHGTPHFSSSATPLGPAGELAALPALPIAGFRVEEFWERDWEE